MTDKSIPSVYAVNRSDGTVWIALLEIPKFRAASAQSPFWPAYFLPIVVFLLVNVPLVGIPETCDQIAVSNENGSTTYAYNFIPWVCFGAMIAFNVGCGEYLRRKRKELWEAAILYATAGMIGFISLQLFYETFTITPAGIIYTREPQHANRNVSIAWEDIVSATKTREEKPNLLGGTRFLVGYAFNLRDRTRVELPVAETLTAAASQIDARLNDLGVTMVTQTIRMTTNR